MKVILSRKGFDSGAGGGYSPWDPKTEKYIVLPIPDGKINEYKGNGTKFEEIQLVNPYLNDIDAPNLKVLIEKTLSKKDGSLPQKTRDAIDTKYAHFDPWLGYCWWLAEESNHRIGALGQEGMAQSHLNKEGVGKGDLFLFYSRFKPLKNQKWEDKHFGISYEHAKDGLYFIYGWLRVKELVKGHGDNRDLKNHPHYTKGYFDERSNNWTNGGNTIYLADGCGYFPELNDELLLTANDNQQPQDKKWIPSRWSLPKYFYECRNRFTYLKDKNWGQPVNDRTWVETPGRGQEFVFSEAETQHEAENWANGLINSAQNTV